MAPLTRTAFRTCPLCEAGCGLAITVATDDDGTERVQRIRGDLDDVFSAGFLCPKGSTLKQLHEDPDRLRKPMVKRDGVHVEVEWPEAWAEIERRFNELIDEHGRSSLGVYVGNPNSHNLDSMTFLRALLGALGTRNVFSASTVDQMPRHVASGHVFGSPVAIPVPDLDRTDFLVLLGANPYASNGSLCTAPNFPGRIERIQERGGTVVVVDPRRTRTAAQADQWIDIRPGTDALLLAAMANTLFSEGLADMGQRVASFTNGVDELEAALASFTPAAVEAAVGVSADRIVNLTRDLAAAPTAAVYGRIGTTTTEFGSTASWLVDAVNALSGNLDSPGGSMFATPVAGGPTTRGKSGSGRGFVVGRGHSRVSGHPEVMGEYPACALAEEITTPGEGQIRGLLTVAGNPVLSTPNSGQLDAALAGLDFMISIDIYLNETTRHADVILPPPSQLQRSHYDVLLLQFAVRNVANFSEPVLPLDPGQPHEWEIMARLASIMSRVGDDNDSSVVDDMAIAAIVRSAVNDEHSKVAGRNADELLAELSASGRCGPDRVLDALLRMGPFGDGFGADPDGTSLDELVTSPHGKDFGALVSRLPEVLRTPSGRVELAPQVFLDDLDRLSASLADFVSRDVVLVGRRDLRSNNSWMHNIEVLVKGKPRCTLHVHPRDAERFGLRNRYPAVVASRVGQLTVEVELTNEIRPGVVSLPHGWGHDLPGVKLQVASERSGANSNVLTDDAMLDPLSGTSVLNGIPVELTPI